MTAAASRRVETVVAGRTCPADYVYAPSSLARAPDFTADTLYVVGGLYGNVEALDAIARLAAAESAKPQIVFNGDFHWLDAEPAWFAQIERGTAAHRRIRGNVETELGRPVDIGAGCGCAYPPSVSEEVVRRSNAMIALLREAIPAPARAPLYRLPANLVARVGNIRVAIVHGDATSVAGWGFAHDALDDATRRPWIAEIAAAAKVDVFASTHTGRPALRSFDLESGPLTIINNGAAGMPNFAGTRFGILTRIATTPSPHKPLYGTMRDGVHIDAVAVVYDQAAFVKRFLSRWPQGSAAHGSYYTRIVEGPDYTPAHAAPAAPAAGT